MSPSSQVPKSRLVSQSRVSLDHLRHTLAYALENLFPRLRNLLRGVQDEVVIELLSQTSERDTSNWMVKRTPESRIIGLQASVTVFRLSAVASASARLIKAFEISVRTAADLVRISLMCCVSCCDGQMSGNLSWRMERKDSLHRRTCSA